MTAYIKVNVHLLIVLLVLQLLPNQALATESEELLETTYPEVSLSSSKTNEIELFEDESAETVSTTIPNETSVELIEEKELVSLIRYIQITPDEEPLVWTGFVRTSTIVHSDTDKESENALISEEAAETEDHIDIPEEESSVTGPVESADNTDSSIVESEESKKAILTQEIATPEMIEDSLTQELSQENTALEQKAAEIIEVPEEAQDSAEPLKTEEAEEPKAAQEETEALKADEKLETEKVQEAQTVSKQAFSLFSTATAVNQTLQGIGLNQTTNVYKENSKSSSVLKTYKQGQIMKFQQYNSEWYSATVYIAGKAQKGFINKDDIDLLKPEQRINGFAVVDLVQVHETPSSAAKVLKTYKFGQAMVYRTFSSNWHKVTIILNGAAQTGYIKAANVNTKKLEDPPASKANVVSLKGIAAAPTVSVYNATSQNASKLKSYKMGHILTFTLHNDQWYKATVYVSSKAQTGYINKKDVELITTNPQKIEGIGLNNLTNIYSKAATEASILKSYSLGTKLVYKTYTASWYEATVYVNGKAQVGYIHKDDVEEITTKPVKLNGIGIKSPTKIYSRASTGSTVLRTYLYGSKLIFKTYTTNWYQATFYINGTPHIGYINKADVAMLNGKVVYLDPGHGGKDGGAAANGIVEKDLVLDISLRVEQLLQNAGFTVLMTRRTDIFLELAERTRLANASNADLFVSIHANAFNGSAKGIETFWYDKHEAEESKRLANEIQKNLVEQTGLSDRRVAQGNYHVIRETEAPSALVEVGFIDNAIDAAKLKLAEYKQRAAEGIFAGILKFFT
ncbi:N-acetylmuramoyl-L-alanine amidase [Planomicrobium soli]|uniref:N-acetylmuramoyl-L-alanine amidase n=1 Tax=Planomicrobium soli TaxID=1176648 RepID=A0A2P8H361_9BACL|nr:N-acetylmuramoyl-L-alanine amidase [Planomicrobium soli]PSL40664.1 N-acetylmuramoyl-L-alanine amidase [Planomicrobium soli]